MAVLTLIAVPLKYVAGIESATRAMGPVHGVAFLFYIWALGYSVAAGGWRRGEVVRMIWVACVPIAGILNQPWLSRKIRELPEYD